MARLLSFLLFTLLVGALAPAVRAAATLDLNKPGPRNTTGSWPPRVEDIPAWVIALDRTPLRYRIFMTGSYASTVFPRLEKWSAVDGQTLDVANDNRIAPSGRVNVRDGVRRSHAELSTRGMAGLYISHVELWRHFYESGEQVGIVFEDDAYVPSDAAATMARVMASMPPPEEWDVWLLGWLSLVKKPVTRPAPRVFGPGWEVADDWFGTHAFMLSRRGAARLLAHAYPMTAQVDAYMTQMARLGEALTILRSEGDVLFPQIPVSGTTVQQLYCDACDLPEGYVKTQDEWGWLQLGIVLGIVGSVVPWAYVAATLRNTCACCGRLRVCWCCCKGNGLPGASISMIAGVAPTGLPGRGLLAVLMAPLASLFRGRRRGTR